MLAPPLLPLYSGRGSTYDNWSDMAEQQVNPGGITITPRNEVDINLTNAGPDDVLVAILDDNTRLCLCVEGGDYKTLRVIPELAPKDVRGLAHRQAQRSLANADAEQVASALGIGGLKGMTPDELMERLVVVLMTEASSAVAITRGHGGTHSVSELNVGRSVTVRINSLYSSRSWQTMPKFDSQPGSVELGVVRSFEVSTRMSELLRATRKLKPPV